MSIVIPLFIFVNMLAIARSKIDYILNYNSNEFNK